MKLKIIDTSDFNIKLKCTIQATGRLGFTSATATALKLEKNKLVKFAQDEEDNNQLYMIFVTEEDNSTFKMCQSGSYFYLPTTAMFESLGFDMSNKKTYIFDLIRIKELDSDVNGIVYKMKLKERSRRNAVEKTL